MDKEQLKKVLAGFGVAALLAGAGAAGTGCATGGDKAGMSGCSGCGGKMAPAADKEKPAGKSSCGGMK